MKRKHKGIQNFLFMAIFLLLFVMPAFQDCDDLMDMEALSSQPAYENRHPEGMASGHLDNCQGLNAKTSGMMLPLTMNPLRLFSPIFFAI